MRRAWASLFFAASGALILSAVGIAACGESGARPPPEADPFAQDGGGPRLNEAGTSFEAGVAPGPDSGCVNTIKDNAETDVDCGGNVCGKCIDGKKCLSKTDCAGGACSDNTCATPFCDNKVTDGDETDTDCGGETCARCGIGKRCSVPGDCVSLSCVNNTCRCPKEMAEVPRVGSGAGGYCVDATEVTKYQYERFLTAAAGTTADQIDECKPQGGSGNSSFYPRHGWPPADAPPYVSGLNEGKKFNYSLPVHYVDWCDAYAYCKWAKKELCGSPNGGKADFAKLNQASEDAWYNACSAGGNLDWPYSTTFSTKCNGGGGSLDPDAGACGPRPNGIGWGCGEENHDLGIHWVNNTDMAGNYTEYKYAQCSGGHSGLFQMSGNVAEWENSCNGDVVGSSCRLRGGSFLANDDPSTLSCKANRALARVPLATGNPNTDPLRDVGFRCCTF